MDFFIDERNRLVSYLKAQLIGPVYGENEKLKDSPHKRYLTGILFPVAACRDEYADKNNEDSNADALNNDFKPSSMAISFAVNSEAEVDLKVGAGKYIKLSQVNEWQRTSLEERLALKLVPSSNLIFNKLGRIDVIVRPYSEGKIVTISLTNHASSGDRLEPSDCLYQANLSISLKSGTFIQYPSNDRFKLDDEQKELDLVYRNRIPWAVGHGVAVDWDEDSLLGAPTNIYSESIPTHEVKDFSTNINYSKYPELSQDILSITRIADPNSATQEELLAGYEKLVSAYGRWINALDQEVLADHHHDAKDRVISKLRITQARMLKGLSMLRDDSVAFEAFRLANKAMLMQMVHTGDGYAGKARDANTGFKQPDYFANEIVENYKWRPFQIAFQLLVLESLIPDINTGEFSSSHDEVDLLWFPTGGGKTEAYLALAAWEMIYRRLTKKENGGGTAVIKRYTLRLLTSQQFQRAGSLICALEFLRCNEPRLGSESFSLGLWAGEGSTPNEYKTAHAKFINARQDQKPENSFQLRSCPWCGSKIMPDSFSEETELYGIRSTDLSFEFFCPSRDCVFHHRLPIQVIDQGLYERPPTLLIGTIDKFARLTWKSEAINFFGNGKKAPPSLIIQDELHLISGPLGTIAGIYEAGFDSIIEVLSHKPKVIAATATIRAAKKQVNRLFGRGVNIFPPSGTDESDSFFSQEDRDKPGRLYIGALASGHTGQTSLIHSAAAALQAPFELGFNDEVLDSYWTLPIYHNSRRELGKTITLARDDIPERVKVISSESRNIQWVEELSAGVKGSKIPEVLSNLQQKEPTAIDILPCTNMISVGVDISRLCMMIIAGQPKTTAEYIQASSRVGRNKKLPPGVVLTQYSPSKPRDRSHYENFKSYHQSLYRYVEPTSITPWAKPALERALHASLIAVVRMTGYLNANSQAKYFDQNNQDFKKILEVFTARLNSAMDDVSVSERADVFEFLKEIIEAWSKKINSGNLTHFDASSSGKQFKPLIKSFDGKEEVDAWKTLNSMRNVDTTTQLYIRGEI